MITDKYNTYYNKLMEMRKPEIVQEGVTWDIWDGRQSNVEYMLKHHTKKELASMLAARLVRLELRGY